MQTRQIKWRESAGPVIKTAVAGDFCPREANSEDVAKRAAEICAEVKPYFDEADLRLLQWECTVTKQDTPIDKSGPNHRCYPDALAFAEALRIDAVMLANNHTGDYGAPGVADTLNAFAAKKIRTAGAGMSKHEAETPLILTANGLKIGVINAAEHEFGIASENRPGAAGLDILSFPARIRSLKEQCDAVLMVLHGGHEHYPFPSPRLQQLCRFLAENGADAVFNCHSHCPCGYEVFRGVPIVYSPGNFYFPPRPTSLPCWYIGYVPKFHFDRQGTFAMELLPYYNYQKQLLPLSGTDAEKFFAYLDELNAPLNDDAEMQKLFDAWCVMSGVRGYLKGLRNVPQSDAFDGAENIRPWLTVRNLFSCESHHDLLRNTLSLIEFGGLAEAEKKIPEIESLRNPAWVVTTGK